MSVVPYRCVNKRVSACSERLMVFQVWSRCRNRSGRVAALSSGALTGAVWITRLGVITLRTVRTAAMRRTAVRKRSNTVSNTLSTLPRPLLLPTSSSTSSSASPRLLIEVDRKHDARCCLNSSVHYSYDCWMMHQCCVVQTDVHKQVVEQKSCVKS